MILKILYFPTHVSQARINSAHSTFFSAIKNMAIYFASIPCYINIAKQTSVIFSFLNYIFIKYNRTDNSSKKQMTLLTHYFNSTSLNLSIWALIFYTDVFSVINLCSILTCYSIQTFLFIYTVHIFITY